MEPNTVFDYERLLDCIHCGLCVQSCPSYVVLGTETDSPRGRIFLMRAVTEGRLEINDSIKEHVDLCLGCRGCETACPSGVVYHPLLETAQAQIRTGIKESALSGFIRNVLLHDIFPDPETLRKIFVLLRFYQKSGLQFLVRKTGILGKISKKLELTERFLPPVKAIPDFAGYDHNETAKSGDLRRVGYLRGCMMDYFYPETNEATLRVIEKCGCTPVMPKEVHCCGAVHMHNGDRETAKQFARKTIDAYLGSGVDLVLTNAAGCGAMMKEYDSLLADDEKYAEKAVKFSSIVRDISEFVCEKIDSFMFNRVEASIVYDDPCHLIHAQKITEEPRRLLKRIPGLEILPLNEAEMCCGSAGTYNITQPEMSVKVLQRKMDNIIRSGAGAVVTGNIGCMIQLNRGVEMTGCDIDVYHTMDLVGRSLCGE